MSQSRETSGQTPQSLADLFTRYLHRQVTAQSEGLALPDPDGQVVPHEAVPVQPIEPRLAWEDALAVVRYFSADPKESRFAVPPDWPTLVAGQEPAISLAFCLGNYPQMVRNLHPLRAGGDLSVLRPSAVRPSPSALVQWAMATTSYPQVLLAAGVLRLARRFDDAAELLNRKANVPSAGQEVWANEQAALAWHRGQAEQALALWQARKDSVPVLFNRGMAALFLGRPAEAQTALRQAVAQLPDTSAWHHLGHLYLALAAARG
jgi:tetratricopeptide (TPR) repeat protein